MNINSHGLAVDRISARVRIKGWYTVAVMLGVGKMSSDVRAGLQSSECNSSVIAEKAGEEHQRKGIEGTEAVDED